MSWLQPTNERDAKRRADAEIDAAERAVRDAGKAPHSRENERALNDAKSNLARIKSKHGR